MKDKLKIVDEVVLATTTVDMSTTTSIYVPIGGQLDGILNLCRGKLSNVTPQMVKKTGMRIWRRNILAISSKNLIFDVSAVINFEAQ